MNLPDYYIKEISHPHLRKNEKVYFFSDKVPSEEIISKKIGELEELLKIKWLISEHQENDVGLLSSFLYWFDNHYTDWLDSRQLNSQKLNHAFLICENGFSYVIIPKEFELEFLCQYQKGLIQKLGEKEGLEQLSRQAESFRLKFNQSKTRGKQAEVIFLTDLEK